MKVMIKPVPTKKWHGKEGKESFARPHSIEVLMDGITGEYATGLDDEETAAYEKKLGVSLSKFYNAEEPHPYWSSTAAKIRLPNHTLILDTERPADFVKVANLKASRFVANSLKQWEEGEFPDATHIIYDEEEETQVKATKIQVKNQAVAASMKMPKDIKLNVIQILSDKSFRGRSDDFIDVEIDKIINNDPADFMRLIKTDPKRLTTKANLLEALQKHILVKEGLAIKYMGEVIGYDMDQAIDFFLSEDNQGLKVAIMEKLIA